MYLRPQTFTLVTTSEFNAHCHKPDEKEAARLVLTGAELGVVDVVLGGETRRVACMRANGLIRVYNWMSGITGRYITGKKAWPCQIYQHRGYSDIYELVDFGRDDHCGQRKVSISFPAK